MGLGKWGILPFFAVGPPCRCRFEGQAPTLVGAGPIFQFGTEEGGVEK